MEYPRATSAQQSSWMNNDIYTRNIGVQTATANLSAVPSMTRRDYASFSAPAAPATVRTVPGGWTPNGVPEPTYQGYASRIHDESVIKAMHKPLSKCIDGATFMPQSTSDLYNNHSMPPTSATGSYGYTGGSDITGLISRTDVTLPNQSMFSNHTRQQTKGLDGL